MKRTDSGRRLFSEKDIELLEIIQCLKITGMPIKDIKYYIQMCSDGDSTLEERYELFKERNNAVQNQIKMLYRAMEVIDYKCDYYQSAVEAGTEDIHRNKEKSF